MSMVYCQAKITPPKHCNCNIGSVDTPIFCKNAPSYFYRMDGKLSDTYLCLSHAEEADRNRIVKHHLIEKIIL